MKHCHYRYVVTMALLSVCVLTVLITPCRAGMNPYHKVAVHVLQHESRTCSKNFPAINSCGDIITTYAGCDDIDIFPVFYGFAGVTAVEFGLDWPADWGTCFFVRCAGWNSIGTIVNPGDGITIAWPDCEYGEPLVIGYGWLTAGSPGTVCPIPHPGSDFIGTCDCEFEADASMTAFCAGACGATGEDPCEQITVPLSLQKSDGLAGGCMHAGDSIIYTITYRNTVNPHDVHNAIITDFLAAEVDFVSATSGGLYDGGTHTVTWALGTVPTRGSGSVEVTTEVDINAVPETSILNRCELTCDEAPTSEASVLSPVCPEEYQPLGIDKHDDLARPCIWPGDEIVYEIVFDNDDNPAWVYNLVIVDSLPPEVVFQSAEREGTYDGVSHTVTWSFPQLAPGGRSVTRATVAVDSTTAPGTQIKNVCEIVSDQTPAGRTVYSIPICSQPRPLTLEKVSDIDDCVNPGENVTYTLTFGNHADSPDAQNVVLTDFLNDKVTFLSATGAGVYDSLVHEITWSIGTVAAGAGGLVTAVVRVKTGTVPGLMRNDCEITSDNVPAGEFQEYTTVCGGAPSNFFHKMAIHVLPHENRTCVDNFPVIDSCEDIIFTHEGCDEIDFFPVVYDLGGYTSITLGITWPDSWGSCFYIPCEGELTWGGTIENPGDAMGYSWAECQFAPIRVMGYGWLSPDSPGRICFCPNEIGELGVTECDFTTTDVSATFCAGACGESGDNPCGTVHTVPSTWGSIKAMFR